MNTPYEIFKPEITYNDGIVYLHDARHGINRKNKELEVVIREYNAFFEIIPVECWACEFLIGADCRKRNVPVSGFNRCPYVK